MLQYLLDTNICIQINRLADPPCIMIGAHARSEALIVMTNDVRDFARMPGVRVETWT
jgi:predicted nucleic acid-binding protein